MQIVDTAVVWNYGADGKSLGKGDSGLPLCFHQMEESQMVGARV